MTVEDIKRNLFCQKKPSAKFLRKRMNVQGNN